MKPSNKDLDSLFEDKKKKDSKLKAFFNTSKKYFVFSGIPL